MRMTFPSWMPIRIWCPPGSSFVAQQTPWPVLKSAIEISLISSDWLWVRAPGTSSSMEQGASCSPTSALVVGVMMGVSKASEFLHVRVQFEAVFRTPSLRVFHAREPAK